MTKTGRTTQRKGRRPKRSRRPKGNPKPVKVYARILSIEAEKADGTLYRHDFTTKNPVIGLPDGSILIPARRNRPLWGAFPS